MSDCQKAKSRGGYRYLFGPVPSRRLGRSLGLDLVPVKTCTFNCRFCEVGRTSRLTLERGAYVGAADILAEFDDWLRTDGKADTITLAGSGEPTLNTACGEILDGVRARCAIRRALLTNSSLMHLPEVRADAARADIVKVSLSAWDQASFEAINRPAPGLELAQILDGLRAFRGEYRGQIWMEVFVLAGVNDGKEAMARIAVLAATIAPDRIQLNTVARPPAEPEAEPVSAAILDGLAAVFPLPVEVIASFSSGGAGVEQLTEDRVLAMLERRPCTAQDIVDTFSVHPRAVARCLGALLSNGTVREQRIGGHAYYLVNS